MLLLEAASSSCTWTAVIVLRGTQFQCGPCRAEMRAGHNRCNSGALCLGQADNGDRSEVRCMDGHLLLGLTDWLTDCMMLYMIIALRFTYSAYPVAHGNLLVSFRMRMGRAMWSAEHSISSGDRPRNSGLMYGNFSGSSEPGLPPPPELPPAMIPPMNPATADLTRVSMLLARRGGVSVGRCAAPRLPFPEFPPSSSALIDDRLNGE